MSWVCVAGEVAVCVSFCQSLGGKWCLKERKVKIKVKFVINIVNSYCLMGDVIFISTVFFFQVATKPIKFKRARS